MDRKIGVFFQPKIPGAVHWAAAVRDRLAELGFEGWVADVNAPPSPLEADLIITLGGDGTILAVARLAAPLDIPILPVNLGRLGFMAEFDPHQLLAQLPELLRGDGWVERRRLLTATLTRSGAAVREVLALNDIVISRGSVARVIRVRTHVDGAYLTTYVGDGVIVATATGSTAYALAAGGPILHPELTDLLISPINPHLSFDRVLIVPGAAKIEMEAIADHQPFLVVDGQEHLPLEPGDLVGATLSPYAASLLRWQPRNYFYSSLMRRLRGRDSEL